MCGIHVEESMFHLIVECTGYEGERRGLINEAMAVFGSNFFENWNEDEQKGMCQLVGLCDYCDSNNGVMEAMKIFLESAWVKRAVLQGRANHLIQWASEHNNVRTLV